MANNDNLVSLADRTMEEQRAIAKKGGIASGEARRKKATMLAVLQNMLDQQDKKAKLTYRELATLGLIKGAVKGNPQNYKAILEMLGEVPKEQFGEIKEPILNVIINNDEKLKETFFDKEGEE